MPSRQTDSDRQLLRPADRLVALAPAAAIGCAEGTARLDVRDASAFAAGHWTGSGHVPLDELAARRSELPPRDRRILVVAENGERASRAADALGSLGYADVAWLDGTLAEIPGGLAGAGPAARLWRPAPFLEWALPALTPGLAIDLAAGAGREAVFLALHGFAVEAWDHDRGALDRACALAVRHGVTITPVVRNLERRAPDLPEGRAGLVTVFRFLHRPLFPHIERALAPGGSLVYETYRRGQARFGRPRHPRFLLDDGELSRAFPSLSVEHYEELDPPEGPIVARLLARRPA
ncbi:MAG TPA: rhodanese-like domain-containing protein [Candidatus Limnocylindria bacterium]|nr:rhodanese-like domain-containing protein [Candidatus Limnocylindria bacterium]